MRPGKAILLGLVVPAVLLTVGCEAGTPSGGPLQSPVAVAPTSTPALERTSASPTVVAAPTLTAVSLLAAASTPSGDHWELPQELAPADVDACALLTEAEAEAATGLELKRADSLDSSTPGTKCRYEAEGTAVSLKVFAPIDETQAARVWAGRYRLYQDSQMSSFLQYEPGVGDAAFTYVAKGSADASTTLRFWYVIVVRGSTYFELLWLTDSDDPTAALVQMAGKIASRL